MIVFHLEQNVVTSEQWGHKSFCEGDRAQVSEHYKCTTVMSRYTLYTILHKFIPHCGLLKYGIQYHSWKLFNETTHIVWIYPIWSTITDGRSVLSNAHMHRHSQYRIAGYRQKDPHDLQILDIQLDLIDGAKQKLRQFFSKVFTR